jgi:hypothetical protein
MKIQETKMSLPDAPDLASYEGRYPDSLFNKGVRTHDEDHVGHVIKELKDKIVIDGHHDFRFIVPKSKIITYGRNVILNLTYRQVFEYQVDRSDPLPEDR